MEPEDRLFDLFIRTARGKVLGKVDKGFFAFLVLFFDHGGKDVALQKLRLVGLRHAESRVQPDLVEMALQEIAAEAVDRGDFCLVKELQLPPELPVPGFQVQAPADRLIQALLDFRRCRPRKGHDEQPVHVHRCRRIGDQFQDPFDQHSRLAAARGHRDQQTSVPEIDHALLFFCQLECHLYAPLISSAVFFASSRGLKPSTRRSKPQTLRNSQ